MSCSHRVFEHLSHRSVRSQFLHLVLCPSGNTLSASIMMSLPPGLPSVLGLLFIVLGSGVTAFPNRSTALTCRDIFFNISSTSFNDSGFIQPAASYRISATYCPPTKFVRHRASTVQLLLHGGTGNKFYWSALAAVGSARQYQPYNYSYVEFARSEGYHTIAVDRLGVGNSSHPDPNVVRAGLQAELMNSLIQQIRRRVHRRLPPPQKVILVGHSYGSVISNILINRYPNAVEATILTGYVHVFAAAQDTIEGPQVAPARDVFPNEFPNLDPGYLFQTNETLVREAFFAADGTFDPELPAIQYRRSDAQAIGEVDSFADEVSGSFSTDQSLFTGPLALMIGQEDQPFCRGDCGTGNSSLLEVSKPFYPRVSQYTGFALENTGHLLHYHYSARKGFELLHDWLETNGF